MNNISQVTLNSVQVFSLLCRLKWLQSELNSSVVKLDLQSPLDQAPCQLCRHSICLFTGIDISS